jgi:hypothetical protein
MSTLDQILFTVGVFVFMMTIYGAVMAGGAVLKQKQLEDLPNDTEVVNDGGFEVFVSSGPRPD